MLKRIFVEKKEGFNVEAHELLIDIKNNLSIKSITGIKIVIRYDMEGVNDEDYEKAKHTIFSEPPVDNVYDEEYAINSGERAFAIEFLPGQFDQRADSAAQCIQLLTAGDMPTVRVAKLIVLSGSVSDSEFEAIKKYLINPVEAHEASLDKPDTLNTKLDIPTEVETIDGFIDFDLDSLKAFLNELGLAMSIDDLVHTQNYFKNEEKRNPTITEIRMLDTYWSDHCRHTTFMTDISDIEIEDGKYSTKIMDAYHLYIDSRKDVYGERISKKNICLMDIATIACKQLKKNGALKNLDESEEINACSIEVDANVDGKIEKWLIMFKNETHNHPTEIEPFGGAATCLGGAIRDPLSGRVYVYQAMRVTGSGDPRKSLEETLANKLPQRKISVGAANGYSSYGNQIGLATGQVREIYDEGYVAKRMEIGAVVGAAPKENVRREVPMPGDIIVLIGGRTGRDGCGGATGSSKEHTSESLESCGAEVQKGNPPTERKIQRLFKKNEVTTLIKRCNDFGAGGVSVAIGELADGLEINLDKVPKKYEGLDGTELAISESQERMAVVVDKNDVDTIIAEAAKENLEAVVVATVTDDNRLRMTWNDKLIVDLSRDFINTNGVTQKKSVKIKAPESIDFFENSMDVDIEKKYKEVMSSLNVCSQKGLSERFDSTIGAASVLMPFGGKNQLTPSEGMAAKIPVPSGNTTTASIMTFGFNPDVSRVSPFHGSIYSIVESLTKLVAIGGDYKDAWLTLQEYFEKLGNDPEKWGKPAAALLGAYWIQMQMGLAAIGGKDSMSGTFNDISVPPTLVSFALAPADTKHIISNELKKTNSILLLLDTPFDENGLPVVEVLKKNFDKVNELISKGLIRAAGTVEQGGIAAAISKMAFGNGIGFNIGCMNLDLFKPMYGSFVLELGDNVNIKKEFEGLDFTVLGSTNADKMICLNTFQIKVDEAIKLWKAPLENVYPTNAEGISEAKAFAFNASTIKTPAIKIAKPKVFIPVFPGTNCEFDSARQFEKAGAEVEMMVLKNLTGSQVEESVEKMTKIINSSQIIMIPGGFSAGDEPEGSGKFIATVFRNPSVSDAVNNMLKNRDGLMLGICNGFQALIKLGLLPYGEIKAIDSNAPTLTYNNIYRHVSCYVNTKITSNLSPWLANCKVGDTYSIPVSHGEGRFVANADVIAELEKNGQVAFQYVDANGNPATTTEFNPNGSVAAIEGISSPDGRVLGKMGHSERIGDFVAINICGEKDQQLFKAGVDYFK